MVSASNVGSRPDLGADPRAALVVGGDDFSVKVSSKLDGRFWVRIERESDDGMLVVTDFAPGDRPFAELAAGLSIAVRALGHPRLRGLVFRDIVPGGEQTEGFPIKLLQAADLAKQLGAAVAVGLATEAERFDMQPRTGKVDAYVVFGLPQARGMVEPRA